MKTRQWNGMEKLVSDALSLARGKAFFIAELDVGRLFYGSKNKHNMRNMNSDLFLIHFRLLFLCMDGGIFLPFVRGAKRRKTYDNIDLVNEPFLLALLVHLITWTYTK